MLWWLCKHITQWPQPTPKVTLCKQDPNNKPKIRQGLNQQPKFPPLGSPGAKTTFTEVLSLADRLSGLLLL